MIVCNSLKGIQQPKDKCRVECDVGTPNYAEIECKQIHGWRPTGQLECTGVAPGVIVGVLFAGIFAVVIIAYGYAKYKQSEKDKELKRNPPPPKGSQRRPGQSKPGAPAANRQPPPANPGPPPNPNAYASKNAPPSEVSSERAGSVSSGGRRTSYQQQQQHPKPRRHTTRQPARVPDEEWHFRNQAYAADDMAMPPPPVDAYQTARFSKYAPADPYHYDSFGPPPPPPMPQVGYQGPPPRPSRKGGIYTVSGHPY